MVMANKDSDIKKRSRAFQEYQSEHLQKDMVIARLRQQGFRITKQRKLLIDIILEESCSCCKEVYVLASKKDPGIGIATVYRTVDALEKVGALQQRTSYRLCRPKGKSCKGCLVELEDYTVIELDHETLEKVITKGLRYCGLSEGRQVKTITLMQEE